MDTCAEEETTTGLLFIAFQSVPAYEALIERLAHDAETFVNRLICAELLSIPIGLLLMSAHDVNAYEAVPANPPVKLPVNEPVLICADAEIMTGLLLIAFQSVPAYEAERAYDDDIDCDAHDDEPTCSPIKEPVNEPVLICAELDTSVGLLTSVLKSPPALPGAHEALMAYDELNAYDDDPSREPVKEPV